MSNSERRSAMRNTDATLHSESNDYGAGWTRYQAIFKVFELSCTMLCKVRVSLVTVMLHLQG